MLLLFFVACFAFKPNPTFDGKTWTTDFTCVDFSSPPYPKYERNRVVPELMSADHFDDVLEDSPDEMRPSSIVLFYTRENNPTCHKKYLNMHFEYRVKHELPDRSLLFSAKYDMENAYKRPWYEWTPERDLAERFEIEDCPTLVFFPRTCNGEPKWCTEKLEDGGWLVGCEDYVEHCEGYKIWNGKGSWVKWVKRLLKKETKPELYKGMSFKDYREQARWLRAREQVTCNTHARNVWIAGNMPIFSETGYTIIKIPTKAYNLLLDFYNTWKDTNRTNEGWDTWGSTQMNFHESPTTLVYLDLDYRLRDRVGHMIRPLAEEWVGIKPLELTSFYGIREYYPGSWLRNHVDRIDTHIISATLSIFKDDIAEPWPLELINHYGQTVRYLIPPGYMALYESAKVPHGRPYRLKSGIHAGCFLHFRPKDRWPTGYLRDQTKENTVHVNDKIYTQRWNARKRKRKKPEIKQEL